MNKFRRKNNVRSDAADSPSPRDSKRTYHQANNADNPPAEDAAPPNLKWTCEICEKAQFDSFREALEHENNCSLPSKRRLKRRKKDGINKEGDEEHIQQQLPATVIGHALDYLPYSEVRNALLVGRFIAFNASRHIQVLNITKCSELVIPPARRFINVEEVNIFCLLSEPQDIMDQQLTNEGAVLANALSEDTASRCISFISSFGKIKRFFIGGPNYTEYVPLPDDATVIKPGIAYCCMPFDHSAYMISLLDSFLGAIKTKVLPKDIRTKTSRYSSNDTFEYLCTRTTLSPLILHFSYLRHPNGCNRCKDVLKHCPLHSDKSDFGFNSFFIHPFFLFGSTLCMDIRTRLTILSRRPEARKILKEDRFLPTLRLAITRYSLSHRFSLPEDGEDSISSEVAKDRQALKEKLLSIDNGLIWDKACLMVMPNKMFRFIDMYMEILAINPHNIAKDDLLYHGLNLGWGWGDCPYKTDVYAKSTYEGLVARGFNIDAKDLIILDEAKEPALKREIPAIIRGEIENKRHPFHTNFNE